MREAGCTATQEIAFTLSNGWNTYLKQLILDWILTTCAKNVILFVCHNDFFEEVGKFRAARQLWHDLVTERFQPNNPNHLCSDSIHKPQVSH